MPQHDMVAGVELQEDADAAVEASWLSTLFS
jgi:hypothetical protein